MSKASKILVLSLSGFFVLFTLAGTLRLKAAADDGAYSEMKVYSEVLSRIRSEYVEDPSIPSVTNGALHGLLESLDPDSSYLTAAEYRNYKQHHEDHKPSIGAVVSKRFGYADVVAVLPGGAAAKAGVESGDILEAIGDKSTREMSLAEIQNSLAGDAGSSVTVLIVRIGKPDPLKLTVTRAPETVPPATARLMEDGIGYIRPETLSKGKAQEVAAQVKALEKQGAKKLVLDLRDTAMGDEQEGVDTANLFLNHGIITWLQGQKFEKQTFAADPAKTITALPVSILVNHGTAGPAEIVAASIMENARGDVLGDKTFGEGAVQKVFEIPDGSALVLSVAKFYSPGGKAIQDEAVTPNIAVASVPGEDDDEAPEIEQHKRDEDQLKRALEIIKTRPRQTASAAPQSPVTK
ncbi:MAG: PDZ domain-containing protein [Acidobacteria bacterium]|nr:PDZ domain-containing protein [Acidobacteriota bacterium]